MTASAKIIGGVLIVRMYKKHLHATGRLWMNRPQSCDAKRKRVTCISFRPWRVEVPSEKMRNFPTNSRINKLENSVPWPLIYYAPLRDPPFATQPEKLSAQGNRWLKPHRLFKLNTRGGRSLGDAADTNDKTRHVRPPMFLSKTPCVTRFNTVTYINAKGLWIRHDVGNVCIWNRFSSSANEKMRCDITDEVSSCEFDERYAIASKTQGPPWVHATIDVHATIETLLTWEPGSVAASLLVTAPLGTRPGMLSVNIWGRTFSGK